MQLTHNILRSHHPDRLEYRQIREDVFCQKEVRLTDHPDLHIWPTDIRAKIISKPSEMLEKVMDNEQKEIVLLYSKKAFT